MMSNRSPFHDALLAADMRTLTKLLQQEGSLATQAFPPTFCTNPPIFMAIRVPGYAGHGERIDEAENEGRRMIGEACNKEALDIQAGHCPHMSEPIEVVNILKKASKSTRLGDLQMATIVKYQENDGHYILLGAGFGTYKSSRSSTLIGDLFPTENSGERPVVAICDFNGKIAWVYSEKIEVIRVDGKSPSEILENI